MELVVSGDDLRIEPRAPGIQAACFSAMASPCEVLVQSADPALPWRLGALAQAEALRIEHKFSRYRDDSVLAQIQRSAGAPVELDDETAQLLDFAALCHQLSEGRFDITSGVLRRAWTFDGSDRLPEPAAVEALLPLVGFERLTWQRPWLTLPEGMQLDLGGIGKEYAVDRVLALLTAQCEAPLLVNFGGDLCANRAPAGAPWQIGVESVRAGATGPDGRPAAALLLELSQGALATSGDARRFLLRDGRRYGHILDPRTGWPVPHAPRSVTVAAGSCTEAGMLATFSLLQGARAREFLDEQGVTYWCLD
jgi:thiamine biosynthesis lipoprotein